MTTRARTRATAAAVLLTLTAGCGAKHSGDAPAVTGATAEPTEEPSSEPIESSTGDPDPSSSADTHLPVAVALALHVGGEQVAGRWYTVAGRGTHWVGLRDDRTWWWGYDAEPQRIEGEIDQPPAISADGGHVAYVRTESDHRWMLVGADTEEGGEGLGAVDLPRGAMSPPPRAIAVTPSGLVVAGGPDFQWLWRPLVDGATVDLAETAPGQVVLGATDAGLVVNEGTYGRTDATQGAPYLAVPADDGTLTRLDPLPTHDVLVADEEWVAYVPPGTVGGEASGTVDLQVQRRDGSDAGVLTAPEGWQFMAPGFRWESPGQLLAVLVSSTGQTEGLARCRPDTKTCELVDVAG